MDKQSLMTMLQAILGNDQVKMIFLLIMADLLSGVAASIATGEFRLHRIADFMGKKVIPYLLGYASVKIVVYGMPEWDAFATAVWAVILAALVGDIIGNLQAFGLNPPASLKKIE